MLILLSGLSSLAIAGAPPAPDYAITALPVAKTSPELRVLHHAGRFRMETPSSGGLTEVEYDAIGQRPRLLLTRDATGKVTFLWAAPQENPRLLGDSGWNPSAEKMNLAGETCDVEQRTEPTLGWLKRCLTADGINLIIRREGRISRATNLERRPVSEAEVTPPFELFAMESWIPPEALKERPNRDAKGDYTVEFGQGSVFRTIRRSGPWTVYIPNSPGYQTTALNDEIGVELRTSADARSGLVIKRFPPGDRFGNIRFRPATVKGQTQQTFLGETCSWSSRATYPDASDLECRTSDGVLLAAGMSSVHGESIAPAISLSRKRVPLSDVLPTREMFDPARYGFQAGSAGR